MRGEADFPEKARGARPVRPRLGMLSRSEALAGTGRRRAVVPTRSGRAMLDTSPPAMFVGEEARPLTRSPLGQPMPGPEELGEGELSSRAEIGSASPPFRGSRSAWGFRAADEVGDDGQERSQ